METTKHHTSENENTEGSTHCQRHYHHGAHAGNIYFKIECWGMSSPVREAEIKRRLDEFISGLQVDLRGL